ncbi:MAG TPA: DNA-3-methyladenine glycosylase I [Prolixibacteraceae bacterium]|nr:DNA-3-methyladenine glycosylase I [Prolixibacteraceae bacterium]
MKRRCEWGNSSEIYQKYHDEEWGVPVYDDLKLFEFLVLESAQAGLSWITILKRRDGYRKAFANYDPVEVAKFNEKKMDELMADPSIIRNRRKIEATVSNAKAFVQVQKEFGSFSNYIWNFVGGKPIVNHYKELSEIPAQTELSVQISKDLKKRGFRFLGPTIVYSHMQATGLVNDHLEYCFRYHELMM